MRSIVADKACAFALPFADHVMNAPAASSYFDMTDAAVPFYQIALSGIVPYALPASNLAPSPDAMFLKAVETGAGLSNAWMYRDPSLLKDTDYDRHEVRNQSALHRVAGLPHTHGTEVERDRVECGVGHSLECACQTSDERIRPVSLHCVDHHPSRTTAAEWLHESSGQRLYELGVDAQSDQYGLDTGH